MKLKKSLVKAMIAGMALGTAVSCSPFDSVVDTLTLDGDVITCSGPDGSTRGGIDNCPACGLG